MGMSVWRILLIIVVIVFVAFAVLLHFIAVFTDHWLQSSAPEQNNFLHIGLWRACFDHYTHNHEEGAPVYDGCDGLYSETYKPIRDWLIPCKCVGSCLLQCVLFGYYVLSFVSVYDKDF